MHQQPITEDFLIARNLNLLQNGWMLAANIETIPSQTPKKINF